MSVTSAPEPDTAHHNNAIPAAVQRAAAEAERLMGGTPAPEQEPPQEMPPDAPQEPPQEEPQPQGEPPEEQHERNWQHDYNSMKGRFERAEADKRAMIERMNGLEGLLAQVTTKPAEPVNPAELEPQRFLTDKELEEYGTEFVDVQKRAAMEALSPQIQALQKEISYLKRGVSAVGENIGKTATNNVYQTLDRVIGPQWEEINDHPVFKEWLAQVDPYAGVPRLSMVKDAFARHDAERVVAFFRGFLAEAAATDPQPPQGAPSQAPVLSNGNGQQNGTRQPLAAYAAPGRAGSAAQPSSAGKPVYTRSDISRFYQALSAGKWRGREAEASAIDADIIAAGREGRVAP